MPRRDFIKQGHRRQKAGSRRGSYARDFFEFDPTHKIQLLDEQQADREGAGSRHPGGACFWWLTQRFGSEEQVAAGAGDAGG